MSTEELVTSPEASSILEVSRRTVHRMVAAGEITPVRKLSGPNGAFLFDRGEVQALADERTAAREQRALASAS